jgi:hypothetical protein
MKSSIVRPILYCSLLLSALPSFCQTGEPKKTTVTFIGGAVFAPRLHYYGRVDSLKSNALIPTLLVQFDSAHLYINGSGVFLSNKEQSMKYAGTILEAGYRFGKTKGLAGNIFANKFFYSTRQLPQSALKGQVGANLSWLNHYVNITASASAAFSDKTDFFVNAGVNHNFKWVKDKSVFLVTPTFIAYAGSQNYTRTYYSNLPGIPIPTQTTEQSKRFNLLSYEFNVPLVYARPHIFFILTPSYVIPQNVVTVAGHPELSEQAENIFYVNVSLLFMLKK